LIANKYRPEIDDLLAEIKNDREEWREGMRPDRAEFKGRNGHKGGKGYRGSEEMHPMGMRFDRGSRQGLGLVTFLLWDVNRS